MTVPRRRRDDRWLLQPARRVWVAVLFISLIAVLAVGFWRFTVITDANRKLAAQARQLVLQGRTQRLETIAEVCRQTNDLTGKLRSLIVQGATSTKRFDRQIRALGFPPYRARLRAAQKQARGLLIVDCKSLNPKGR